MPINLHAPFCQVLILLSVVLSLGVALWTIAFFVFSYSRNNSCLYHQSTSVYIVSKSLTAVPHTPCYVDCSFAYTHITYIPTRILKKNLYLEL